MKENKVLKTDENSDEQIALTSFDAHKDVRNYLSYLDNISKILTKRLDELEEENRSLKTEVSRMQLEINEKNIENNEYKQQIETMNEKYAKLTGKLDEINEKYEKEQKKANLLEVENTRHMDELKSLRKENKALQAKTQDSEKVTFKDKLVKFIKNDQG